MAQRADKVLEKSQKVKNKINKTTKPPQGGAFGKDNDNRNKTLPIGYEEKTTKKSGLISGKDPLVKEKLDKSSKDAIDKERKREKSSGGIFGEGKSGQGGRTLPSGYERKATIGTGLIGGKAPITKDDFKKTKPPKGYLEKLLAGEVGTTHANEALNMLTNPGDFVIKTFTSFLPELAGIVGFIDIIKSTLTYLTQPGMPFDVQFKNTISTLVNALRPKQLQQQIGLGYQQLIITAKSGYTSPKDSYNTFRMAEYNNQALEKQFMVRNPIGY